MIIAYKVNYGDEEFTSGHSKEDIVNKLYTWRLEGENRQLFAQLKGYKEGKYMSFDEELTKEYVNNFVIRHLLDNLTKYGYTIFKSV